MGGAGAPVVGLESRPDDARLREVVLAPRALVADAALADLEGRAPSRGELRDLGPAPTLAPRDDDLGVGGLGVVAVDLRAVGVGVLDAHEGLDGSRDAEAHPQIAARRLDLPAPELEARLRGPDPG